MLRITEQLSRISNSQGFTLIEVLISILIFGVVLAGAGPAFILHSKLNTFAELRSSAEAAAQVKLDSLRFTDPQDLPNSGQTGPEDITVGSHTYQVTTKYCSPNTYCTTNTRQIKVSISYKNETQYEVETVFTKLR